MSFQLLPYRKREFAALEVPSNARSEFFKGVPVIDYGQSPQTLVVTGAERSLEISTFDPESQAPVMLVFGNDPLAGIMELQRAFPVRVVNIEEITLPPNPPGVSHFLPRPRYFYVTLARP